MKTHLRFATLILTLVVGATANADVPTLQRVDGAQDLLYGGTSFTKASRDTVFLLGGAGTYTGRFEDHYGNADWQGWTHRDQTYSGEVRWHVDTYNVPAGGGNYAMWCGQRGFPDCGAGYGNNWDERLVFTHTVADPTASTSVTLACDYNVDSEFDWDWFVIQQNQGGSWVNLHRVSGTIVNRHFEQTMVFQPHHYVGDAENQIQLRFLCTSDGNTSDEDCFLDSEGHAQVDNIRVTIGGISPVVYFEDHEDGDNDYWTPVLTQNVGDFAQLWTGLRDMDPCLANSSAQVAFIDDGIVVPGTGGTNCITWCYGPGGYIVNNTGGLVGPEAHLQNIVMSPVLTWPENCDGAILAFTSYRHEEEIVGTSAGIYYQWHVRSALDAEHLAYTPWQDRNYVYYGGPDYIRNEFVVTDLLVPGRTLVQIALRCVEYGWVWGYTGADGTPAPYLDNVVLKAFPFGAPAIAAREIDLANDGFPARGDLDLVNLANNSVRFDMARNIAPLVDAHNDPGDSIFVDIGLTRAGAVLHEMPRLVVKMKTNPLFDPVRNLPPGFTRTGDIVDGFVFGDSTFNDGGGVVANRYHFDLPDTHFFYPGDVIHYYILAQDEWHGEIGTSTLPADISQVGDFEGVFSYGGQSSFIVRALPSLRNAAGDQPEILFWNDFANRGGENEWYYALNNLGYNEHLDYDVYYTNGPSSGVGNGLGGRATPETMTGYDVLLYTSGDLAAYTLSNGDVAGDPSPDLALLDSWFARGGKKALLTGDDLAYSLTFIGGSGLNFLAEHLGVSVISSDLRPLISQQTTPAVRTTPLNSVFTTANEWVAYGGCPIFNALDAIVTQGNAERLARFLNPSGAPDYDYAAAVRNQGDADVILLPYDFSFIYNSPGQGPYGGGYPVRAAVLRDILITFGKLPRGAVIGVPDRDLSFGVTSHPNPFNPVTEVRLTLPDPGPVRLRVYNVRGALVRTLADEEMAAGVHRITWNGTDDAGREVAAGVYFYETRYGDHTDVRKTAFVK